MWCHLGVRMGPQHRMTQSTGIIIVQKSRTLVPVCVASQWSPLSLIPYLSAFLLDVGC